MTASPHIAEAVQHLRAGGVVAFPTETVYGLGADALDEGAVARVFALKQRPANNPLIVHVADAEMAKGLVQNWPPAAQALAARFWPGPLSIVLPRASIVPASVAGGGPNVAVRCPDHPLTLELLRALGRPLVGPSANPSGLVSPTTAAHVREAFGPEEVLVLDGGPCARGIESTVVTLAETPARVLRPGLVSAQQIAECMGGEVLEAKAPTGAGGEGPLESPGQLARHYAPHARCVLVDEKELRGALARFVGRAVVVSHVAVRVDPPHELRTLPADAAGYAAGMYAALREADASRPGAILVVRPAAQGDDRASWLAVLDRLGRAAVG